MIRRSSLLLLALAPSLSVAAEADRPSDSAVPSGVLDCPAALDRFETLVRQYAETLKRDPTDSVALSPLREELVALDERAGRLCLRYYTRGLELYSQITAAEQAASVEPLLPAALPPPELPPDEKPHRPHFDVKIESFDKPVLGQDRPAVCLEAPLRPESGLMVGIAGLVLGSAIGISLLQFDGKTERGIGYGFLFSSAIFSPSAGHWQAEEDLEAWLWAGGRAAASSLAIAGFASATGDEDKDNWLTYSGLVTLGVLIAAGLVDGVLAVRRTNQFCAPYGTEPAPEAGSGASLFQLPPSMARPGCRP